MFCPEYKRFYLDKELEEYSSKIGKLFFPLDTDIGPALNHMHPAFDKSLEDETHFDVRKYLSKDKNTYMKRKEKNFLWGESFNKIYI